MNDGLVKQIGEKLIWCLKIVWRGTYIKLRDRRKARRYEKYWKEHRICRGLENKDKTFYIVRRQEVYVGLFSFFIVFVNSVKEALEHEYIPVIDMQNNFNIYLQNEEIGHVNAWEFFFQQPMGYTLKDIKYSRHIIVGSGYVEEMFPYKDVNYLLDAEGEISDYKEVAKQYFRLSKNAQKEVDEIYTKLIAENDRVLGVLARGTDYTSNRPSGHHIQPTMEQLFTKVNEVMTKYQCNKIFLGTEDYEIYTAFVKRYPSIVITNRNDFIDYHGEKSIGKLVKNKITDLKKEGMDYLVAIAILARCNCFVGGHTSGTVGVMFLEKEFEYKYIFDLGLYD